MSNEVEVHRGSQPTIAPRNLNDLNNLAKQIAATEFVPRAFRGRPEAILACMLYGNELGLGSMQSLNLMQSIEGSVGLTPEGMRGLIQEKGHNIRIVESTNQKCTIVGHRRGDPPDVTMSVTWTIEDAKRAKLVHKKNWEEYPRAMLLARATSELGRAYFADVIGGLSYTTEEIGDLDDRKDYIETPALTVGVNSTSRRVLTSEPVDTTESFDNEKPLVDDDEEETEIVDGVDQSTGEVVDPPAESQPEPAPKTRVHTSQKQDESVMSSHAVGFIRKMGKQKGYSEELLNDICMNEVNHGLDSDFTNDELNQVLHALQEGKEDVENT